MGYWAAVSYALSNKIKGLIESGYSIDWVEFPDGFGIGYFTAQSKLTLEDKFTDLKILVTSHCPVSYIEELDGKNPYQLPRYFMKEMEKFTILAADAVICPSSIHSSFLMEKWGVDKAKLHVVFNPCRIGLSISNEPSTFEKIDYACAARISPSKGIPELLSAFDLYWQQGGASNLHLFGADGTNEQGVSTTEVLARKYKKWVDDKKLVFRGNVDHGFLAAQTTKIRALFHPSKYETFAYAVAEHMAKGGVVATSNTGGHVELFESGRRGFSFSLNNTPSILEVIRNLDGCTKEELQAIGSAAAHRIEDLCGYSIYLAAKENVLKSLPREVLQFPFVTGDTKVFPNDPVDRTQPLLSIVIPHFNLGDLVEETVTSALESTLEDIEILIVDDCSTDPKSIAVIGRLEGMDRRIRVIRKQNSGVAETRNRGASEARGKYIALLDADDTVEPTYYERAVKILNQYNNVGFVGCWNNDFDDNGLIKIWTTFNPEMPRQLVFNTTNCAGIVVRRQAYLDHGQYDKNLRMFLDDWEGTIALMCAGVRGVMIPQPLFNYRIRPGSLFRDKRHLWERNYSYIAEKHSVTFARYSPEIVSFLNANGPNTEYSNPTFPSHYEHLQNLVTGAVPVSVGAGGRLDRMVRGYYNFVTVNPSGRKLRRWGHVIIEPIASVIFAMARLTRKMLR